MTSESPISRFAFAKDIRFWILIFVLLRLYGITNAPLETAHNWRQTTVTMVARNYLETDANILYPRIDIAGEKTGITGMEFPLLNYLMFLVAKVFGYTHWYGRLITLLISSAGLWYFYLLVRKYFTEKMAFVASMVLLFSVWFTYSRKIMPDTFAMSFVIAAMYYGSNYLDKNKGLMSLIGYAVLLCLGVLSKLPVAYLLIVFVPFIWQKSIGPMQKTAFALATALAMVLPVIWYFWWVPGLVEIYGFHHFFMGKGIWHSAKEIFQNIPATLSKFYDDALKYIGFGFFLVGLFFGIKQRNYLLLGTFLLAAIGFAGIMFKSGSTFWIHTYYIVPFAPVMALVCAYGILQIKSRIAVSLILVAIGCECVLNKFQDFHLKAPLENFQKLETVMDQTTPKNNLILINSGNYPTPMYFAHRKGWVDVNAQINRPQFIDSLNQLGLQRIVLLKNAYEGEIPLPYSPLYSDADFVVYDSRKKP